MSQNIPPQHRGQRISGYLVGNPQQEATPSGKPYTVVHLSDLPVYEPDRTTYEVAIVTDRGRHQVEGLKVGDPLTVQGKVRVDDVVNAYTGEVEQKYWMIARDAYVSWADQEMNTQSAAQFAPSASQRPKQPQAETTRLAVEKHLQQHPHNGGVSGPSM